MPSWCWHLLQRVRGMRPLTMRLSLTLLVLAIGYLDYATEDRLSLSVLYLPLVSLTCWYAGLRMALWFSALCSVLWLIDDLLVPEVPTPDLVKYWHTFVRFATFAAFAWVLSRLKQSLMRERYLARYDGLTGVYNAQGFFERAEEELARCRRYDRPLSVIFLDCDHFKQVNDTLGHAVGDQLLRTIGRTLEVETRRSDIVGRMGGDEFVLVLCEAGEAPALATAEKLRAALLATMRANGWGVTFSIGVATFYDLPVQLDDLLREADAMMYAAKHGGRDQIRVATHGQARFDEDWALAGHPG